MPKRNKQLIDQYRMDNWQGGCEVAKHIQCEAWEEYKHRNGFNPNSHEDLQVHHIWGGTGRRWDVLSNIVLIKNLTHLFMHEKTDFARLVCVFVRVQKGEFDRDEMRDAIGMDPIGVIECMNPGEAWLADLRLYVLERF